MEIENNTTTEKFLEKCINKEIKDIFVTGWTEIIDENNFFASFPWYYYIQFKDFFICIESSDAKGMIFYLHEKIQCNFEIEEDDIFTYTTASEKEYQGFKIESFDVYYSKRDNSLWGLGIEFNKEKRLDTSYAFFDALTFDGIVFGNRLYKDFHYGDDERFYLEKYPS